MRRSEGFAGQKLFRIPMAIQKSMEKSVLNSQLYITDIGYFPKCKEHLWDQPLGDNENKLIYCTKGFGWLYIGGKKIKLSANQHYFIPKKVPHKYESSAKQPWDFYWIHYLGSHAECFIGKNIKGHNSVAMAATKTAERIKYFNDMLFQRFPTKPVILGNSGRIIRASVPNPPQAE
jgi:AraC family transcriptional regulator of arabinose operon